MRSIIAIVFTVVAAIGCQGSPTGIRSAEDGATSTEPSVGAVAGGDLALASATEATGFFCRVGIFDGYPWVTTFDSHAVRSSSGKVTLVCRGQLPAGAEPESAVVQRSPDFPFNSCNAFFAPATRWQQVITPSGEITLRCQA